MTIVIITITINIIVVIVVTTIPTSKDNNIMVCILILGLIMRDKLFPACLFTYLPSKKRFC